MEAVQRLGDKARRLARLIEESASIDIIEINTYDRTRSAQWTHSFWRSSTAESGRVAFGSLIEMLRTELAMTKEEYRQALADELRRLTNE